MAEPLKVQLPAGRHTICACGRTAAPPRCDGSHQGTGLTPQILDLEEARIVAWCTCRSSGKLPMCDGSHRDS